MSILSYILFSISTFLINDCTANQNLIFHSQASQDEFVYILLYNLLEKQDTGSYLEIGASHPITINNSYFFEKNFNWKGVGIDISTQHQQTWADTRNNTLLIQDATQAEYDSILEPFPPIIDYLSIDIDDNYDIVLKRIPFDNYIFKIITIEHDCYSFGAVFKNKEREILTSLGYYLLCADVSHDSYAFEDWWIHPSVFPPSLLTKLKSLDLKGKDHKYLINILQSIKTSDDL